MFKGFKVWSIIYIVVFVILGLAWGAISQSILTALAQAISAYPELQDFPLDALATVLNSMAATFFISAVLVFLSFLLTCILGGKGKANKGVFVPALIVGIVFLLFFLLGLPLFIVTLVAMSRTKNQIPARRAPERKPAGGSTPSAPRRHSGDEFGDDEPIPADYGMEEETPRRRGSGEEFGDDEPIPADYGIVGGDEEETPRRRGSSEEFGDDDPIPADYGLDE